MSLSLAAPACSTSSTDRSRRGPRRRLRRTATSADDARLATWQCHAFILPTNLNYRVSTPRVFEPYGPPCGIRARRPPGRYGQHGGGGSCRTRREWEPASTSRLTGSWSSAYASETGGAALPSGRGPTSSSSAGPPRAKPAKLPMWAFSISPKVGQPADRVVAGDALLAELWPPAGTPEHIKGGTAACLPAPSTDFPIASRVWLKDGQSGRGTFFHRRLEVPMRKQPCRSRAHAHGRSPSPADPPSFDVQTV